MICTAKEISKMFGGNVIFENLSFEIKTGDRIGIVGRNGTGKTTVFKLLAGIEPPDSGDIFMRKGTSIGYLSQIPTFDEQKTAKDVLLLVFQGLLDIQESIKKLEQKMADPAEVDRLNDILEEYGKLQDVFSRSGGYEIESDIDRVSNGLGVTPLLHQQFQQLSGGEQTKVMLASILLEKPDLLLLDEPTNHLDIQAVEWLEDYLSNYEGTVVIVSHDRRFLDQTVKKIFDLDGGEITIYHQNYSGFVKEKEERLLQEFARYEEQQKKIKKMKEAIKRLKEWANQANPPNEGLHKRARNMERALARMEKLKKPILEYRKMALEFDMNDRSGRDVLEMKSVAKRFGEQTLLQDITFRLQFKERVAIVGENGSGKSTILKMIMREVEPDEGIVNVGSNVKIGYLSQHIEGKNQHQTVLEAFRDEVAVTEGEARRILAGFLFYGPAVFHKVNDLSGGERMRLRLAILMNQELNMLILDEPTNHLDIDSREVLEDALEQFPGTILCVSHDRYLLMKLFPITYWLENGSITRYIGTYDEAKEKRDEARAADIREPVRKHSEKKRTQTESPKQPQERTPEWMESEINQMEDEIFSIEKRMEGNPDVTKLMDLQKAKEILEKKRDMLYEELEEIM